MTFNINTIKDHFPKWSILVEPLYQKNESFHSLCEDYLLLVEQVRYHSAPGASISTADRAELQSILSELKQEMIIYFEEDRKERNL